MIIFHEESLSSKCESLEFRSDGLRRRCFRWMGEDALIGAVLAEDSERHEISEIYESWERPIAKWISSPSFKQLGFSNIY